MALLAGKPAVITGGSSGIGLATARRFIDEGATVFITGRKAAELETAAAELGPAARAGTGRCHRARGPAQAARHRSEIRPRARRRVRQRGRRRLSASR